MRNATLLGIALLLVGLGVLLDRALLVPAPPVAICQHEQELATAYETAGLALDLAEDLSRIAQESQNLARALILVDSLENQNPVGPITRQVIARNDEIIGAINRRYGLGLQLQ